MKTILFICGGNSCRSQMAEGFARFLGGDRFKIRSAGIFPVGVHPMAIWAMTEIGIDISDHACTMLNKDIIAESDYIVTLCREARDDCPPLPPEVKHIHWDIENPDKAYVSEEARQAGFARVRDEIKRRIEQLLIQIDKGEI
ncbi:Protein ArsC [Candidatus Zixiibacteriota bacterium]|nr:Protein ArsC [candidate division Zixibacteria bacterium]